MAALEADRLKAVEVMESVIKSQITGTPLADIGVGTIQRINARHAPMAIEALTKILPESVEQSPQWAGADPVIVEALTDLAARASDDVLETHVLTPLVGPWKHDVWATNGNRAKFDARVRDAHESVPPCWAMGPRGAAFARVLARASEYNGIMLPKARLLIREIADDAGIHGVERRVAAEPWVSQLIEWYIVLGELAPAEHLLWDLDPLDRVGLRVREYGSADGFPDWYDPEEDAEWFPTRVESDWKEYLAAKDRPSGVPEPSSTTRVRNWSARLRHHATMLTKIILHKSEPSPAFGFGGGNIPTPPHPPAELFNNPATIDVDTVGLAEARAKGTTWPIAASSALDDLLRSYGRSAYSLEQLRVASQATLARLITDEAGSWHAEIRIGVLWSLYERMRKVAGTDYRRPLLAADGSYGGTFRVELESHMSALVERLSKYPGDAERTSDRRLIACKLLVYADAPSTMLLHGSLGLVSAFRAGYGTDLALSSCMIIVQGLDDRFSSASSVRLQANWAAIMVEFAWLLRDRAQRVVEYYQQTQKWEPSVWWQRSYLELLNQASSGASHSLKQTASPDTQVALAVVFRIACASAAGEEGRRNELEIVQASKLRLKMLLSGWDV